MESILNDPVFKWRLGWMTAAMMALAGFMAVDSYVHANWLDLQGIDTYSMPQDKAQEIYAAGEFVWSVHQKLGLAEIASLVVMTGAGLGAAKVAYDSRHN